MEWTKGSRAICKHCNLFIVHDGMMTLPWRSNTLGMYHCGTDDGRDYPHEPATKSEVVLQLIKELNET